MTITPSTPPTCPEATALDLLVDAAETTTGSTAFRAPMQDLAGALHAEDALAGLAWGDARLAASAIAHDACTLDDPARGLRARAAAVRAGTSCARCADPEGVAQALGTAATVLGLM